MKSTSAIISLFIFTLFSFSFSDHALAAKKRGGKGAFAGGSLAIGFGVSLVTAEQSGLNSMISTAKTGAPGGTSTSNFGTGLEYSGQFTFTFSNGYTAIQLRPSYFTQSTSGSATDGTYSYNLTGFTFFPLVRLIPLANDVISFYVQGGLGYGKLDGEVTNGPRNITFSGSNFGMQIGVGADFYLFPDHGFGFEGSYRYLPIQRNIVTGTSGAGTIYGTTQTTPDRELEDLNGSDVATTLSGISGAITYTYNF